MTRLLPSWVRSFVDIRPGEGRRTALLFIYYLLVLFAYYILKPVSRALFLNNFDPDQLPWLYILMALLGGAGASWMSRAAARERLTSVIEKSQLFLIGNILLIWWLLHYRSGIVLYAFSIWVGTFSIVTVGQFWLLANNLFDPRSARRLFPLIGLAAVAGGILGGTFTSVLVQWIAGRDLMLACGGLVALTMLVVRALGHEEPPQRREDLQGTHGSQDTLELVWNSPHLRAIGLLVGVMFIVDTLVDYQFSVLAKESFRGPALTAFLARFQGIYLNVLSLVLQLFLTGPVLRRVGVGGTLAFAPLSIAAGAAAMLIQPSIVVVAVMRGIEAAARYTFTRTGLELLYLPVAREVKNRAKVFLEVSVDRASRAVGGGLLLLCTVVFSIGIRGVTALTIGFVGIWGTGIVLVLRSYMGTLRQAMEKREVHLESVTVQPWDAQTRAALLGSLDSPNERQVTYALHLLEQAPEARLSGPLRKALLRLVRHPSAQVRQAAFRFLALRRDSAAAEQAQRAVAEDEPAVRAEAVHYLCQQHPQPAAKLQEFLRQQDLSLREAALRAAADHHYPKPFAAITDAWIEDLLPQSTAPPDKNALQRRLAAAALAFADPRQVPVARRLESLLRDPIPAVARAAAQSARETCQWELVPILLDSLARRALRAEAREALAAFGGAIFSLLRERLYDTGQPEVVRLQIPRLLEQAAARDPNPAAARAHAAEILVRRLPGSSVSMRLAIIKALNRIRKEHPEVRIPGEVLNGEILFEARHYFRLLQSVQRDIESGKNGEGDQGSARGTSSPKDADYLLMRSLEECLDQTLERIFRLLGLHYPPEDVYGIYRAMRSPQPQRRAAALEFLDNMLDPALRQMVLPIAEEGTWERLTVVGFRLFGLEPLSAEESLRQLIRGEDAWLKTVAIYRAAELQLHSLEEEIQAAVSDPDTVVAETAMQAQEQMRRHARSTGIAGSGRRAKPENGQR